MVVLLFNLLLLSTCGYAILRGGGPERFVAALLLGAAIGTLVFNRVFPHHFENVEVGMFVIDLLLLAGLVIVSLYADRYWTLWVAALHAFTVAVHLVRLTNPHLVPLIYSIAAGLMSIPMQIGLALATWRHQQRMRLTGIDNSWSAFSPRWIRSLSVTGRAS